MASKKTQPQRLVSQDIDHIVTVDYETKPQVYGDEQCNETQTLTQNSSKLMEKTGVNGTNYETFSAKVVL